MSIILPNVVIISCCDSPAIGLAEEILDHSSIRLENNWSVENSADVQKCVCLVDTKYYMAKVGLCAVVQEAICTSKVMTDMFNAMEAIIVQFDSNNKSSFENVQKVIKLVGDFEPEVRILVCSSVTENSAVLKSKMQKWCLQNKFELVELNKEDGSDEEDDFAEATGVARIIQTIHAHTWPNLLLKVSTNNLNSVSVTEINTAKDDAVMGPELGIENITVHDQHKLNSFCASELKPGDKQNNDAKEPAFESLFQEFQSVKDKMKSLPISERKAYAEEVAMAFWKAINGNDDDIDEMERDLSEAERDLSEAERDLSEAERDLSEAKENV